MSNLQKGENRGALVPMGPCSGCGASWSMYESEKAFFENLIATKNYRMPKRCKSCRNKKRFSKEGTISIPILIEHLKTKSKEAAEGAYDFHEELLADDFRRIAESLSQFMDQNAEFFAKLRGTPTDEKTED